MAAYFVIATILFLIVALYSNWARPSALFLGVVFLFLLSKILSPEEVLNGLANKQIAVIFLLVMLIAGFRKAFGKTFFNYLFKASLKPKQFLLRMILFLSTISAFINNTPIVAFMVPYVKDWLDEKGWPVSKFMIPLCFATVLGGMITVVGTSSNLLLAGLIHEAGLPMLNYKDFLFLGLLVTVTGLIYLYTLGYRLLPNKKSATAQMEQNMKEYVVETVVEPRSHLIGATIASANLRNLKDIYLFSINRGGHAISPVAPEEVIEEGDLLFFSGQTAAIAGLMKNGYGLSLPDTLALHKYNHQHCIEAIVPANSMLVGKKVKDTDFRKRYNASIIALHRQGKRVSGSVGETELDAGDLLLLLGNDKITGHHDLFLLKRHDVELVVQKKSLQKTVVTVGVVLMLILGIVGVMDLFMSAALGILLFFVIKTLNLHDIRTAFDFDLAVLLVASLAIGLALTKSGAAQLLAETLLRYGGGNVKLAIALLFLTTVLITTVISNAATVAIVFPLALSLSQTLNISATPAFIAVAFAASCDFLTPIGYQCNMMVYGPGNYSFKDFFKAGAPLTILYTAVCLLFIFWYYNL